MRDNGGGASSAITVSSRELVVRGAVGASLRVVRRRGAEVQMCGVQRPSSIFREGAAGLLFKLASP